MPLPNFIIAGERRSGTTSLTRWMENHPDIFLHPDIDMGYFIDDKTKGRRDRIQGKVTINEWDQNHSVEEYSQKFEKGIGKKAIGEKSADYFFWEHAHPRIFKFIPDIKILLILRNPVERAWSQYWNEFGKGRETLPFIEAIKEEKNRIEKSDYYKNHTSYISRGYYDVNYSRLIKTFPEKNVFVVTLDEIKNQPIETIKSVYRFLGVDENKGLEKSGLQHNKNWTTFQSNFVKKWKLLSKVENLFVEAERKILKLAIQDPYKRSQIQLKFESSFRNTKEDQALPSEIKKILLQEFLPHIEEFEKLVNKDLSSWKK